MSKKWVTIGWDFRPTITTDGIHVLPRGAENIIHRDYYPTKELGEWPICPKTGERLPMWEHKPRKTIIDVIIDKIAKLL